MAYGVIYKITNLITGMLYIGQTIDTMEQRFSNHCSRKTGLNYLQNSIKAHGRVNFTVEKIAEAENVDDLNNLEIHFIKELNTLWPNGYNLTEGGRSGKRSEESKRTASRVRKGIPSPKKGKKYGPCPKISLAQKGKKKGPRNPEFIHKPMLGKNHSQETKDKISKNLMGHNFSPKRAVISTNIKTNECKSFESIKAASISLNVHKNGISNNLSGLASHAGGFKFQYKESN